MTSPNDNQTETRSLNPGFRVASAACFAASLALAMSLGGCNTTEGFGKDIESAGESIEDAAD